MGGYTQAAFNLASPGSEPERFLGATCDTGFFATLGVSPMLGRLFTDEEDQAGRDGVVILSYGVWKQRFGGDRDVLGRNLNINGRQRTVIGIMPRGFDYPAPSVMWAPLGYDGPAARSSRPAPPPRDRATRAMASRSKRLAPSFGPSGRGLPPPGPTSTRTNPSP